MTPPRSTRDGDLADRFASVTQLAKELGVTPRALRFYEDKGLLAPRRMARTRVYTHRDRARMILILRGKQLGFSLREIKDYLALHDADPKRLAETRALLTRIEARVRRLEDQRTALDQALTGLKALETEAMATLAGTERRGVAAPPPTARAEAGRDPATV